MTARVTACREMPGQPAAPYENVQTKKNPLPKQWVFRMAHSGGFEPPTARFVAEYSIQLSYECVVGRIIEPSERLSTDFFFQIQEIID